MVINLKNPNENYIERTEVLQRYFNDIRKYEQLSAEDERLLFHTLKNGTKKEQQKAKDTLFYANQRFIISVAKKYGSNDTIPDLISEGNIALNEAMEKFDPSQGVRFMSFAVWYIRRAMNFFNINHGQIVKKSNYSITYHLLSKITNNFVQKEGREPTDMELLDLLTETSGKKVKELIDVLPTTTFSIDTPIDTTDAVEVTNTRLYNEYSANDNGYTKQMEDDHRKALLTSLLSQLKPRERKVIELYFGIGQFKEMTLHEIAKEVNLTTERVRQMCRDILKKLKNDNIALFNKVG